MTTIQDYIDRLGDPPGDDPIERLRHTVRVYRDDYNHDPSAMAVQATAGCYGRNVRTGLTYGDLAALEKAIREDEREKTIDTLKRSGHIKS